MNLADAPEWSIQVTPKTGDNEGFGRHIRLTADGILIIGGYDGLTRLSEGEAIELAQALFNWARVSV